MIRRKRGVGFYMDTFHKKIISFALALFLALTLFLNNHMNYTELQVTSNFSFLQGASHAEELMEQAAALGYQQMALTDENSFAGLVRGHMAAKNFGFRFIPGVRLQLQDGAGLLAYPTHKKAYSN